jgi:hypothetical protein
MTTMLRQIDPPPAATHVTRSCDGCGYDLRGIVEARCPECGLEFDPIAPPVANVPWFHRRSIGWLTALWRTFWLATLQTQWLVDEVRRDTALDRHAAQSFRWICVGVATCSTTVAMGMALDPRVPVAGIAATALPLLVFFHLATVLMYSMGFDSPGRRARFETLQDFTAAPLLLMPIVPMACVLFLLVDKDPIGAILPAGVIMVIWFGCKLWYQTYAAGRETFRRFLRASLRVIVWGTCALVCYMLTIFLVVFSRRLIGW